MLSSTVERVDCMVAEQYNISSLQGESTLSTERQFSLGIGVVIEGIIVSKFLKPPESIIAKRRFLCQN